MKLSEYIAKTEKQLVERGDYKTAKYNKIQDCEISFNMTGIVFDFAKKEYDMNQEVEEVIKKTLGTKKINAYMVAFDVVKPRCRKPEAVYSYVKPISV